LTCTRESHEIPKTDIRSFASVKAAAQTTLKFLHSPLGFDLWMVTTTEGDDWIVMHAEVEGYGVEPWVVFRWAGSFCSRMTQGLGPRIARRSNDVPVYAAAPIGQQVAIGACVGIPITREDGSLFGTLCAIDPDPQPQSLTGLYNRRAWNHLANTEEERCKRYGHAACVLAIDLDGLKQVNDREGHDRGDEFICRAANAIRSAVRQQDIVARVGGDEFLVLGVVLGVECGGPDSAALLTRLRMAMDAAQVPASIGLACRNPRLGLSEAIVKADEVMYRDKRSRKKQLAERNLVSQIAVLRQPD
jgi:diguanylate cyclase